MKKLARAGVVIWLALTTQALCPLLGESIGVSVKASPAFSFEPATIVFIVNIQVPDVTLVCLQIESTSATGISGSSCWSHVEGRKLWDVPIKNIPAGVYSAQVGVLTNGEKVLSNVSTFEVFGKD